MLGVLQPIFGAIVILAIAVAFSTNRRAINWTTVAWGLSLQVVFALIVLKTTIGQRVFATLGDAINKLLGFSVFTRMTIHYARGANPFTHKRTETFTLSAVPGHQLFWNIPS